MKKILFLVAILALSGIVKVQAQCTVSNLTITIKNVTSGPTGCQVTLDASFTGDFNNGNKFAFIHLWENEDYPNPTINYVSGTPPTSTQLANAVATIVIKDPGNNNATLHNQYPPNTTVDVVDPSEINFSKTGTTFTLENIVVTLSTCNEPVPVKGDVWASQSKDAQNVHCFNSGIITILFNNPAITFTKNCDKLILGFQNEHDTIDVTVVAKVFIDVNNTGVFDSGDEDITGSLNPALPATIDLPKNMINPVFFPNLSYLPFSNDPQYDGKPIIVEASATVPDDADAATVVISTAPQQIIECATLPVTFTSFTAKRDGSNVVLQWETSSEQNNTGFAVERNINGAWVGVTFVPSQAAGGNSSSRLVYKYEDLNAVKGVSQYRLKQVDIDGQFKYSQVRSVSGEEQAGKVIVYPNPSGNGKVSVVFEEINGKHDISLMDITGRVLKQWKAVYNNVQIDNLASGVYHLRIISRETGKQTVEKIVVSRQ